MYEPKGPYVFHEHIAKTQSAEQLMFKNYPRILKLLNETEKGSNLEEHLKWLLEKANGSVPVTICPICMADTVKYFTVIEGGTEEGLLDYSFGSKFTCCEKKECVNYLMDQGYFKSSLVKLLELKFVTISEFKTLELRNRFVEVLREVFNVAPGKKLTKKKAFEFFTRK
ncbi:MAG: hypothetical protein ABFQ53_01850 [Patescibacteria group bacterium]